MSEERTIILGTSKFIPKKLGSKQNRYDLCVANKQINGKTCTIAWHVDDLKISHEEKEVVSQTIKDLEKEYGKMSVTTGDVHTYCGMTLRFTNQTVIIDMKEYLLEAISEFDIDYSKKATTPAATYLFDIDDDKPKLDEDKKTIFH